MTDLTMTFPRTVRLAAAAMVLSFITSPPATAASEKPACSQGYMEIAPADVIAQCDQALRRPANNKSKAAFLYVKGRGFHRTGRLSQATENYDASLALNAGDAEVHVSRSWAGFSSGDGEAFFRHAEAAYALAPKNARMWDLLGFAMMQSGDTAAALDAYSKALALDPAQPFALLHRSQLFEAMKRPVDALNDLNRLVEIPQDKIDRAGLLNNDSHIVSFHAVALLSRGDLLKQLGRRSAAQQDYERAIVAERSERTLMALAGLIQVDPDQVPLLVSTAEAAVSINPASLRAARMRAHAYTMAKRHQEAADAYARIVELAPADGFAHYSRAVHLKSLQQFDAVASELAAAFEKDPRAAQQAIGRMVILGHWKGAPVPETMTDPLRHAFRACAEDPRCI